jgi:integrase
LISFAIAQDMTPLSAPDTPSPPRSLDQVRDRLRTKHYSIRTENQYVFWIRRFILFHGKRHPCEMGATEVEAFLCDLAVNGQVAAATQNQALSVPLVPLPRGAGVELPWLEGLTRAKRTQRLPVVLTPAEVRAVLERMDGLYGLMARLLYGTGMRLMECVRLRVKDVAFGRNEILALAAPLRDHLARRRVIYEDDLRDGRAAVWLPDALAKKYPHAATE